MINRIIVGALGLVASVAATPLELVERNSCRDDSLYKCFADREYSHSASAYCSALTPVTHTVTVTKPTVTKTSWVTSTAAASTDFISSTTTIYTATIPSSTETATDTTTATITTTATVTGSQPPPPATTTLVPLKRGAQRGKPEPPKCMLTKCFVYSPERITAGCSCIGVPPKTVTVSQTAPCSTITLTSTSTTTPHVTATAWQTVVTDLSDGVSTTTTTVTATTTTTTIVTATPPAPNVIPNGDFSSGLTGWSIINSFPAAWVNAGVSTTNSPDGTSKVFQVTNIINNGQYFIASPLFGVQASSSYSLSFLITTSSTDTSVVKSARAQLNCGSITVASPSFTQLTQGPGSYWISTTAFNTPIASDPITIGQLGRCQLQLLYPTTSRAPVTWFLADVALVYRGAISAAP